MLDRATTQDGGVSNLAIGSFTGDGTIAEIVCGFLPRYIKLVNLTDLIEFEVMHDFAAGVAIQTVAAGTRTQVAANITRKSGADAYRGFEVPAAINLNAKAFHYIAFG